MYILKEAELQEDFFSNIRTINIVVLRSTWAHCEDVNRKWNDNWNWKQQKFLFHIKIQGMDDLVHNKHIEKIFIKILSLNIFSIAAL